MTIPAPLAVAGNVNVDLVMGPVEPWPHPGTETVVAASELRCGGAAGNVALTWRGLGRDFQIAASTGRDTFGDWLRAELSPHSGSWPVAEEASTISVGLTHPDSERTFFTTRGHVAELSWPDVRGAIDWPRLAGGVLLVCGSFVTDRLADGRNLLGGTVRLSASQPVACYLLPQVLLQMRAAMPDIQIELVVSNQVSNLLQREADIALRMVRPEQASLVAKRIAEVSLSACASRDYLARCGTPQVPTDLLAHELIGMDQGQDLLRGFAAMGHPVDHTAFALRTDDLIAAWEAVRAGLGVGFAADYLIRTDVNVQTVLPMLPLPALPIWLTVHREIRSGGRIRAVYDFLAKAVPEALTDMPNRHGGQRPVLSV